MVFGLGPLVVVAERYTYRSSGRGGSAGGYSESCGEWPFGSYVDVYASENTSKINGNGKPGVEVFPYMSAYFSLWSDCTAESATLIEPNWDYFYDQTSGVSLSFPGNNKLQTGSASGLFQGWQIPCTLFTYATDDDGEGWTSYECDYTNPVPVDIDVEVDWTGTGSTYQDRSTYNQRFNGGRYMYSTKGTSREAIVDISVAGIDMDYTYGSLFKSTSTSMEMYKY